MKGFIKFFAISMLIGIQSGMVATIEILPPRPEDMPSFGYDMAEYNYARRLALHDTVGLLASVQASTLDCISELRECGAGDVYCELGRPQHSYYRTEFENEVVAAINTASQQNDGAVHYVNFASGHSFQDLIIGTRACEQAGLREFSIHLIDIVNTGYIQEIEQSGSPTIQAFSPRALTLAEENCFSRTGRRMGNDAIHTCYSQLKMWFMRLYPEVKCRIFLHKNVEDYIAFCQSNGVVANVCAAADIIVERYSIYPEYCELLNYIFDQNRFARAFNLSWKQSSTQHAGTIDYDSTRYILRFVKDATNVDARYQMVGQDHRFNTSRNGFATFYRELAEPTSFFSRTWVRVGLVATACAAAYCIYKRFFRR